jgi:hypothetical protein
MPHYLNLYPDVSCRPSRPYLSPWTFPDEYNYALDDTGRLLLDEWQMVPYSKDGVISGVLADYLEENRSLLLEGATGPTDPGERLDRLISYLRNRCVQPVGG